MYVGWVQHIGNTIAMKNYSQQASSYKYTLQYATGRRFPRWAYAFIVQSMCRFLTAVLPTIFARYVRSARPAMKKAMVDSHVATSN